MAEEWATAFARDVAPLLARMNEGVEAVIDSSQDGDLAATWEAMRDLGRTGERTHEAMQPYVTGEIPTAMPGPEYEALADVCWASHAWFTAVQEVEAVATDAEMTGEGYEAPVLAEQIEACVATWKEAQAKLAEAGIFA